MSAQSASSLRSEPHLCLYASHFGLREDPFRLTPDERYFFPGSSGESLSDALQWSLVSPKGVCLLTGPAGCGKTALLRHVIDGLPPGVPTALLWNANLGYDDFLISVCRHLDPQGAEQRFRDPAELLDSICQERVQLGFHPVVVVDEAHHLPPEVLARFQELCQIRTDSRQAMAIVLAADDVGRDRLVARLGVGVVGCELPIRALKDDETRAYVRHRLRLAGCSSPVFVDAALDQLQQLSGGIPRIINVLAGKALFLTYLENQPTVTEELVKEVAKELWSGDRPRSESREWHTTTVERLDEQQRPKLMVAAANSDHAVRRPTPGEPRLSTVPTAPMMGSAPEHSGYQTVSHPSPAQQPSPRRTATGPAAARDLETIAVPPRQGPSRQEPPDRNISLAILIALGLLLLTAVLLGSQQGRDWAAQSLGQIFDRYVGAGKVELMDQPRDQQRDVAQSDRLPLVAPNSPEEPAAGTDDGKTSNAGQPETAVTVQTPQNRAPEPDRLAQPEPQTEIRDLLQRAVAHVRMQQFTAPKGNNAYEDYRAVLQQHPDHPDALRGIQAIQTRLKRWARIAERRGDWKSAARFYTEALVIEPESEALAESLQRVQTKLDVLQSSEASAVAGTDS